jgi:hypothetical protein
MIDPEADIAEVGADVVDPIGSELTQLLVLEIMDIDLDRPALRPVVAAPVLDSPTNSFFFASIDITG